MRKDLIDYLKIIQTIINRLANNSFLIKGWAITITLGGLGFYLQETKKTIFLLAIIIAIIFFWLLDSYYLRQEKLFRKLYEKATKIKIVGFNLTISSFEEQVDSEFNLMFSYPTCLIYLGLISMTGLIFYYG